MQSSNGKGSRQKTVKLVTLGKKSNLGCWNKYDILQGGGVHDQCHFSKYS